MEPHARLGRVRLDTTSSERPAAESPSARAFAAWTCVVALACLFAAACGSGARESDVIATSDGFHAALEQGDGRAACRALTEETAVTLAQQEKRPCDEAILELELPAGARAGAAEVNVTSAYADLPGDEVAFLDQGPDGWRIAAAGCVPTVPEHPFDCELGG